MNQKVMQVGVTVITLAGETVQGIMEMPAGGYVPLVGDGLTFDEKVCTVTERYFQVDTGSDRTHCKYTWDIKAEQK